MSLLIFKCSNCGQHVTKITSFKDIFTIKTGKKVICKNCGSEYSVGKFISKIGEFYMLLITTIFPFVWLVLTVLIDKIANIFNLHFGIEAWLFAAILYIGIEVIIASILPLKKCEEKEGGIIQETKTIAQFVWRLVVWICIIIGILLTIQLIIQYIVLKSYNQV